MEILQSYGMILIILAAVVGFVMAWGIGANDVANAMGTSVGSKALTIKQAIIIAMIFEFAGAYLAGGEVTSTIRKGIIDTAYFIDIPEYLVLGMISALFAAGIWLGVASYLGWPVSTTHSIVGGVLGAGRQRHEGVRRDALHQGFAPLAAVCAAAARLQLAGRRRRCFLLAAAAGERRAVRDGGAP